MKENVSVHDKITSISPAERDCRDAEDRDAAHNELQQIDGLSQSNGEVLSLRALKPPQLKYHAVSDVGLFRDNNEDTWLSIPEYGVFVVADGLGGHQAGEVASKEAIETFKSYFEHLIQKNGEPETLDTYELYLSESLSAANREIFNLGQQHSLLKGMGTTFSLIGFFEKKVVVLHVGDSRVYRFHSASFEKVTEDHLGIRSCPGKIYETNSKGFLTKALGTAETIVPQMLVLPWQEGDMFLVCSDGLSDLVSEKEINKVLSLDTLRLEEKVRMLVQIAKEHGGQDNITVLLIHVIKQMVNGE
jgi:protein phosphatase